MKTLQVGECYFMLSYFDEGSRMPLIETYVFLGLNLLPQDNAGTETIRYLREPDSYLERGDALEQSDLGDCIRVGDDTIELVLDLPELLEQLRQLAQQ